MKIITHITMLAILMPTMSYGEDQHNRKGNVNTVGVEALSAELRGLLSQEMQASQRGMMSVIPAYVSGN